MTKKRLSIVQLRKSVGHDAQPGINTVLAKRKELDGIGQVDNDVEEDDVDGSDGVDGEEDEIVVDDEDEDDSDGDSDDAAVTTTVSKKSVADDHGGGRGDEGRPKKKPCTAAAVPGGNQINEFCNDRTVYIEGLPYAATEADVTAFFESCGHVESVRLPRWQDSGRLRGYGHVQFSTAAAAKRAITELDGCDMNGRYIKVDRPQTPRILATADRNDKGNITRPAGCRSVFVKNIPYDSTEEDMTEAFKVCGPITNIRLAVWGNTKQLKGFGYIDFKREDSAEIAVKKSGKLTVKGRPVLIDFETGAPKASFRKK